jgi:REP element-mobilizing transposase RayT
LRIFEQTCHEKPELTCAGVALAKTHAAGALYHIIVRGIERRKIFWDDEDRDSFVKRLSQVLTETQTDCFAWALIPNHHLLLCSDAGSDQAGCLFDAGLGKK